MTPFPPFEESRRLTGPNLHFAEPGAVLDTRGAAPSDAQLQAWQDRVQTMRTALGWPLASIQARRHASGVLLAFAAPFDQLFCATEVNEWAWLATLHDAHPRYGEYRDSAATVRCPHPNDDDATACAFHAPGHPAAWDSESAVQTLQRYADSERRPALIALQAQARARRLRMLVDEEELSLGSGAGAQRWPLVALPTPDDVDWNALRDVPVALVTGSNGKTTTVRLIAAMLRAHGLATAWSCTDGLYFDGARLEGGDYSGPAGARAVLRHPNAQAAVLESARGGLLRRGLALDRADVAVVTNISVDHFGEYGIHDLDGLADTKLIVARAVLPPGWLVLNADDAVLWRRAPQGRANLGWFALDHAAPRLLAHRAAGGASCGVDNGVLILHWNGRSEPLGAVAAMPLALGGTARYNVANLAAAALASAALGIAAPTIAAVLKQFGERPEDNPGRLQIWRHREATVIVDYAHNVDGLRGVLEVARSRLAPKARLGILLGHAGNRRDAEIRELADVVLQFDPSRIVLKDIDGFMRGRVPGEIAAVLGEALLARGVAPTMIEVCLDEAAAARGLIQWAQAGDVVVLPLHATAARDAIVSELQSCSS